jgi:hypothetical protein
MFYPIEKYPILKSIQEKNALIVSEFNSQKEKEFMKNFMTAKLPDLNSHTEYWIKEGGFDETQIGYDARDGSWASFPLFKKGFPIKWYDVEECFPETINLIRAVPGVNFASFFRLGPNSGAKRHSHLPSNLIFHLCLVDLDKDSELECNNVKTVFRKKGDHCLFNYSLPHSSFNFSNENRINLVIDFTPSSIP